MYSAIRKYTRLMGNINKISHTLKYGYHFSINYAA